MTSNIGYRGSSTLKKANVPIEWTEERVKEFLKCKDDVIYFGKNYMKIINVDQGLINLPMYDYQEEIIKTAVENRLTVAECSRQSGKTTSITVLVLWYIIFHDSKTVAILANKGDTAREILSRIQLAFEHLPQWLQQGVVEWNKGSFVLENNSRVIAAATSSNNIRGYSINMLILDEAAFIENWDDFFTSVYPTISSGKTSKLILVSTVNGLNHFYKITSNARKGLNNYKLISVPWQRVPGRDEKWKQETLAALNWDYEKFSQEFENEYLGSSGTLIAGWKLKELVYQIPIEEKNNICMYEIPKKEHIYSIIVDVSRGKGLDYSAFQIIDITEMPYKQVVTYRNNFITPGDFAEIISRFGKYYNEASCLVEINDIGQQVADMLWDDFEYENMLFTVNKGAKGKTIVQYIYKEQSTDRGIRTTKTVKNVGCSMLKLLIEQNQLIINDFETISELSTFSRKGNSYEAEDGCHDDLTICLVLFAWMTEQQFFKDLTDIYTLKKMKEIKEEEMENNLLSFGYIDDGRNNEPGMYDENFEPNSKDAWEIVSQISFFDK